MKRIHLRQMSSNCFWLSSKSVLTHLILSPQQLYKENQHFKANKGIHQKCKFLWTNPDLIVRNNWREAGSGAT
jgi:hypothetical protein